MCLRLVFGGFERQMLEEESEPIVFRALVIEEDEPLLFEVVVVGLSAAFGLEVKVVGLLRLPAVVLLVLGLLFVDEELIGNEDELFVHVDVEKFNVVRR
jgi:hypothetical protein